MTWALPSRSTLSEVVRCSTFKLLAATRAEATCLFLPDGPATLGSRALAYWLLDEHDKARSELERARQFDPPIPDWEERFREFEKMF